MNSCTIDRNELLAALDAVKGCVATKTFSPILTHVLFDNDRVFAFDSEVGVRYKLPKPLDLTFNVRFETLYNLVRALDGGDVTFELEGQTAIVVKCGKHRSRMFQVNDKHPEPPTMEDMVYHDVSTGFKEALERCLVAASDAETEKVLSSVLVKTHRLYATDRGRIVRCALDEKAPLPTMLLSRKSVEELIRLGQPGKVGVSGGWSLWDYGNLTFVAALREGDESFPPIDRLFEERLKPPAMADMEKVPDGLVGALTRLSLFLNKEDHRITTRDSAMAFELVARAENGECVEYLDKLENPPLGKGFNPDKMTPALKYASHLFWGRDHRDAIYMRGLDCNFEYVLSPMVG